MHPPKSIGAETKILSNLIGQRIEQTISAKFGLTKMQAWIIGYIYFRSPKSDVFQKDIETHFNIRRSTATGILQLMEKNGLLTRESVSYDARLKKLVLTEKSAGINKSVIALFADTERELSKGLTDEELDCFFKIIDKIKTNAQQMEVII